MKAAVLYGPKDFQIEEISTPRINENEYLLNIKACGVCHSELHQWSTKVPGLEYPRYIGHEISGEILDVGSSVSKYKVGDRVAAWVDGKGYAQQIAVTEEKLFLMSDDLPFDEAILEPVACTTNGVMKANIQLGDSIALVGIGFMGLILLQQLKLVGASKIIAIDIREEMLGIAKNLGADEIINPLKQDAKKIILDSTNGIGVDVSFEVGGLQATLDLAAELLRMEGKLVIFGYHPGQRVIKDLGYWNWMAFDVINAHFRNLNTILKGSRIGMGMLNTGKIDMKILVTHKLKLNEINKAFELSMTKPLGFIKSVLVME
jgi:threonine dehydrogenase-like Zn-dependent dehydrogenase